MQSVHSVYLRVILTAARRAGIDSDRVLAQAGVERAAAESQDARVPRAAMIRIWAALAAASDVPAIGLRLADLAQDVVMGAVEFAIRNCPTVGDVMHAISRYARLLDTSAAFELDVEPDARCLTYRLLGESDVEPHGVDFAIAYCLHRAAAWTGAPLVPVEVALNYRRPADITPYASVFGESVSWGQPQLTLRLSEAQWARRIERTDNELARVIQHVVESQIAALPDQDDLPALIADALLRQCAGRAPSLADVARQLGTSTRSLQRRLRAEGTNFRELSLGVRLERAAQLLRAGEMALAEVAYAVGFADLSAFHRAFRKAYDETPAQYRDRAPA